MATLVLRSAGAALGTALGGPLGGLIGGAAGAVGGAVADTLLSGVLAGRAAHGPDLPAIPIMTASEDTPLRKVWGRMRLAGTLIWCAQFRTVTKADATHGSGKGGGGGVTRSTHYTLSFAVAFCEGGPGTRLGRVWADGRALDLTTVTHAFHDGSADQLPDGTMESVEGVGAVPAYRGVAVLVFTDLSLDDYGNRMPQITAEIIRRPPPSDPDDLASNLMAVALLPGAGEFVLGTTIRQSSDGFGRWYPENAHAVSTRADLDVALDQLTAALPALRSVMLIVAWFGTDLRAGRCRIVPKVVTRDKSVIPADWSVAGLTRATAETVSQVAATVLDADARSTTPVAAYGGTPSDDCVREAIAALRARGLSVAFNPFVMMDIPPGNTLPDPWGGAAQPPFPWRGRITCDPAPGRPGSPDRTAAAAAQVAAFFAAYRPMVLHYADLCAAAGGVDAFLIGSELVGLTQVRSSPGDGTYPAVDALRQLAADAALRLGPTCRLGYAADWSEYHSHRPADGSGDVIFNLDPLWADPAIAFIGIDNYLPLSDWRDGSPNIDADPQNGPVTNDDPAYLRANVEGGEYYDWYYASDADRLSQTRTPIRDTAYGKPWVFRQKDIRNWWSEPHVSRPGGVETGRRTAFVPGAKPIWFTEFGCPAVDKGSNLPSAFPDPKSSAGALPWFSRGTRDDAIQRAWLSAVLAHWRQAAPVSTLTGQPMVAAPSMFAWAWDARPFPDFPARRSTWSDALNYAVGHWLNGRLEQVPLAAVVTELCAAAGVGALDTRRLTGPRSLVQGFVADGATPPRDSLASLMDACQFDLRESGGVLTFFAKDNVAAASVSPDLFVMESETDPGFALTRKSDGEVPAAVVLSSPDLYRSYAAASVSARRNGTGPGPCAYVSTRAVLDPGTAADVAASLLAQASAARESATVKLPLAAPWVEPGDLLSLALDGLARPFRVRSATTGTFRTLTLDGFDPGLVMPAAPPGQPSGTAAAESQGPPLLEVLDLPLLTGTEAPAWAPRLAAYAAPWTGVDLYRFNGAGYDFVLRIADPADLGELAAPLPAGPVGRWDRANRPLVRLLGTASLLSRSEAQVLAGSGALALRNDVRGDWEVLQYTTADLAGVGLYRLGGLLRGQRGTEGAMQALAPAGSRVVCLDPARLPQLPMARDLVGLSQRLRVGPGGLPPSGAAFTDVTVTVRGIGERPFAVAQLTGRRDPGSGDLLFGWLRRTRLAGDSWDPDIAPLNEETELYDIEICTPAGVPVRLAAGLTTPAYAYPAAMQRADFGALPGVVRMNVYQRSAAFGRGECASLTVAA